MANLYRKPIVVVDPKTGEKTKTKSKKWWGQFKDASGRLRRHPLAIDKGAAQAMLNELVRKVEREKAGLVDPTDAQVQTQVYKCLGATPPKTVAENPGFEFTHGPQEIDSSAIVIDTVAERESLTATEADLDDRIAETASKRGADPGQLYASLQKAGRLKELERNITEDKVFKWLLERNTVE